MTDEVARCAVCTGPLPPPPARGGRARDYCSRACQQRAYRSRAAGRADTGSAAGLLAAVRAVAAALDAGGQADPAQTAAVRDGAADLLARAAAVRHVTGETPGEAAVSAGLGDVLGAAVAAVARLGPDGYTVQDRQVIATDGTHLGVVERTHPGRWEAWLPGGLAMPAGMRTHRTRAGAAAAVAAELARRAGTPSTGGP